MLGDLASQLAQRIADTPLESYPFDHLVFKQVFPEEVYRAILEHSPEDRYFRPYKHGDAMLPDGRSARLKLDITPEGVLHLPANLRRFWKQIARAFLSNEVTGAFMEKYRNLLEKQTGKPLERIKLHPSPIYFRDNSGYKISIHPDSPRKALTAQFYIPKDESQAHLGTVFSERLASGEFKECKQMEFLPNSGYSFGVCPTSWHSVKKMTDGDKPRNTLMIIYFYDRGPITEGLKYLQKKLKIFSHFVPSKSSYLA